MYYKDNPYGHASYPQHAVYGTQRFSTPGYESKEMYGSGGVMDTVKGYFTNPMVVVAIIIIIIIIIALLMSRREGYHHY
jgi:predicted RND superfamily exporter protein